jgi:hypothetical protein
VLNTQVTFERSYGHGPYGDQKRKRGIALPTGVVRLGRIGCWGFQTGQGLFAKIGLGIGTPLVAAVVWGLLGAPGSSWQLHDPWHLVLEVVIFGAAVLALFAAGKRALGLAFALVFVLNRALMYAWGQ